MNVYKAAFVSFSYCEDFLKYALKQFYMCVPPLSFKHYWEHSTQEQGSLLDAGYISEQDKKMFLWREHSSGP